MNVGAVPGNPLPSAGQSGATFVTPGSGGLDNPFDLVFGPDGNLYVGSTSNNNVLRFNGTTGAFIDTFVPSGSGGLTTANWLTFR